MPATDFSEDLFTLLNAIGTKNSNALGNVASGTLQVPAPYAGQEEVNDGSVSAGYSYSIATLTGNLTAVNLPAPTQAGEELTLVLIQDSTGSRTVGSWTATSGSIKWQGASAPTLTTTAGHADVITFKSYDGVNWWGSTSLNYH